MSNQIYQTQFSVHYFIYMSQRIKVVIRPKPLSKDQLKTYVSIDPFSNLVSLSKPNQKQYMLTTRETTIRTFQFCKVFDQKVSQEEVYQQCGFSLVSNVLQGYNGTIFAYGQTGSGKTYTIMGSRDYMQRKNPIKKTSILPQIDQVKEQEISNYLNEFKGIIPRAFNQIITVTKSQQDKKHLITCSFIQIYNQNVHDLLGDDIKVHLNLKENANKGLVIEGLKNVIVKSVEELEKSFKIGYRNRSVRQTTMNKESSRSHCIFTIKIEEETTDEHGNTKFKVGKLNLVDLAGSERQNKTQAKDDGIKEATKINLSLSALGKVINCLSNFRPHQNNYIPYRDSKLTRILQDSLGGNTKTVMIGTIATNTSNYEETLSTLIYASRAKFIQNTPVKNEDPKDVLLRQYMQQIKKLKTLLIQKELENQGLKEQSLKVQEPGENQEKKDNEPLRESVLIQKIESEEKEIKKKIEDLQNIVKKDAIDNDDEKKQLEKIESLKKKIKRQEERQLQLERQKKEREEELLSIEKDYKTLNEEVDTLRQKFKDLKGKYLLKCEQLQDFKQQYNDDKEDYHVIIKQKDKQIKKLEKLLASVLEDQTYKQVVDEKEESEYSEDNSSHYSTKKLFNNMKVENKAKIKINEVNLFRQEQQEEEPEKKTVRYQNQFLQKKQKIVRDPSLDLRYYQSQHQKKAKRVQERASYTSLKNLDREQERKQKVKKVDSMISLKPKTQGKLPFITEVGKLNNAKKNSNDLLTNRIGLDVKKIKNEILNELKISKGRN